MSVIKGISFEAVQKALQSSQGLQSYQKIKAQESGQKADSSSSSDTSNAKPFSEYLKEGVESVNKNQLDADKSSADLAVGKQENIHETMIAISQAEVSFKLMVQVRNKALEAYQEIMKMQV